MSSTNPISRTALPGPEAVLVDQIGNEVYASHYAERKSLSPCYWVRHGDPLRLAMDELFAGAPTYREPVYPH